MSSPDELDRSLPTTVMGDHADECTSSGSRHLLESRPDADGIIFDPASGRVLVVSGRGKTLLSFRPVLAHPPTEKSVAAAKSTMARTR